MSQVSPGCREWLLKVVSQSSCRRAADMGLRPAAQLFASFCNLLNARLHVRVHFFNIPASARIIAYAVLQFCDFTTWLFFSSAEFRGIHQSLVGHWVSTVSLKLKFAKLVYRTKKYIYVYAEDAKEEGIRVWKLQNSYPFILVCIQSCSSNRNES